MSDLTRFTFPGRDDPRQHGNMSKCVDGLTLTTRLKVDSANTRDPAIINEDEFFKKTGHVFTVSTQGQDHGVASAPGTHTTHTTEGAHGEQEPESALIPTCRVKLPKTKASLSFNENLGANLPTKSAVLLKQWEM